MHFKDLSGHLVHLNQLNRHLHNLVHFFFNVFSDSLLIDFLKVASLFLTVVRSHEKVHLHKSILSLALRKNLNGDLIDNGFLPWVPASAGRGQRKCIYFLGVSCYDIFDLFGGTVLDFDELTG